MANYKATAEIAAFADVKLTDHEGKTPLFNAVQQRNESVVRALIDAGADINRTDNKRRTALFYAVQQSNNESVVRALIDAGADINRTDNKRRTALFYAVQQSNNESLVRALINAGTTDVNITDNDGKSALFYAVQQSNNESVVRALIDAGADINRTDNKRRTALFYAVQQSNNENVVRALIDADTSDVNITDNDGKTALFHAVQHSNNESVVRALIDAGTSDVNITDNDGKTALFHAVQQSNNESVVRALIDAGADLNTCDIENKTALFHAVQNNNEAAALSLIKAGSDVNKKDKTLRTCLMYAVLNRNECLTKALIGAAADVNAIDVNIRTALIHAVCSEKDALVRVLIEAGAHLNIQDIDKKTPLIHAIENSNVPSAIVLIKAGADLNVRDKGMKTALVHAVLKDNEQLVSALISRGANVNASDRNKRSPLTHAVLRKSENIALALIEAGTDVNLTDNKSKTPLIYAAENEQNYFCLSLVDSNARDHAYEDEDRTYLIKAVADNFQKFIGSWFALTEEIPEDIWLSSVIDEIKKNKGDSMEELSEIWLQAYKNVRLYRPQWERVLVNAIHDNEKVIKNLADQCSSVILSEYDILVAITCTARLEHEMIVQGRPSRSEREKKGIVWIEDFVRRITSSERRPGLIKSLLNAGADVNQRDIDGKSALIHALQMGKQHLANIIIQHKAEVNTFDKTGRTALIYAVRNNEPRNMVQSLINAGGEINHTDNKGKTALIYAVHNEDHYLAKALIEAGGADVNITDASSKSALIYAVEDEKEWLARKLIENGADVNLTDKKSRTSLIYAAQNETECLACALIDAGCDVNTTDSEYKTALIHAVQNKNNRLATFLISQGAAVNLTDNEWKTALIHAVKSNGDYELVQALITAGTDVNAIDKEEKTALIHAVQNENRALTSVLIAAGTDVNIFDNEEATALIYSIQNKNKVLANELIQAGSEIDLADSKKKTALIYATQHELEDITVNLVDAGAKVHVTDDEGKTALFYAVQNEFLVSTLIKAGADANAKDNYSRTPLFYAVANEVVVRQLVEDSKCGVKSRDVYGRTPLCYALTESLSTSQYLVDKGENIHSIDFCGLSNLSFFIDYFLLKNIDEHYLVEGVKFFVKKEVSFNTVFKTIINVIFCKILSSYLVLKPAFNALKHAKLYVVDNKNTDSKLQTILALMTVESSDQKLLWESNVPKILSLLMELGANQNSVDSDGNTALHYATCLPFMGVSRETVKQICSLLQDFGVLFNIKNYQGETPLLFCLRREVDLIETQKQKNRLVDVEELAYVWEFLLQHGSSVEEATAEGSSLHLVLKLFRQGLRSFEDKKMKIRNILDEALRIFDLFASAKITKGITVNRRGRDLDSPLHLWASLRLNSEQKYSKTIWASTELQIAEVEDKAEEGYQTLNLKTLDFRGVLIKIFHYLLECGVQLNDRNAKEETPLHLCRTWTAVELMLDAGANPNDLDGFGRPPLLAAAKKRRFYQNSSRFYPDSAFEKPKAFWTTALKKGLDPWTVDKNGESVFGILIASEAFVLAEALLEIACKKNYIQSNTIALSLLNAICKDDSTRTLWKSILVERILKSRRVPDAESGQDTPLHYCCRNITKKPNESVHWTIAKLLLSYGADYALPNKAGESCLDIADSHPALKELLVKPMNIDEFPIRIPWLSVSKRYQPILAKTARQQESWHHERYWCHNNYLASGSFGLVYAGIDEKDGREVAIKRIEKERMKRQEHKKEIRSLTALAECKQVVHYLSYSEDTHFCYVVLELMEGNLDDYIDSNYSEQDTLRLCKDIVKGLKFLHAHKILHRDLKPSNILYRCHPKLCLKIADFGLSRRIDSVGSTSVYGSNVGTRCWIAPEVLTSVTGHSTSSDIFACGLVLHYTLSGKRHPFKPTDCENKSFFAINNEIEINIGKDNKEGWDDDNLSAEAAHLIGKLLQKEETERPTATVALAHPLFWTEKQKLDLLIAVGNQPEFQCPRSKVTTLTGVENDLELSFPIIVRHVKWDDPGYVHMSDIYNEMMLKRKTPYDTFSAVELVRFIRNAITHASGTSGPAPIKTLLLEDFLFLKHFPNLVCEVYKVVTTYGWGQTREEIKYALKI